MSFEIDYSKIGQKPDLYVCRPNLTTIGKLSDAFNIKLHMKLSQINELSFSLNYYKDINHKNVVNPNYNLLKPRYLIKFVLNDYVEYFLINLPEDSDTEDSTLKNISCFSLAYKLSDELINGYKTNNSVNATTALTDILSDTAWTIGFIHNDFNIMFRQFDITGKSALDAIYDIANTFGALVVYNTLNYTVNFYKLETYGLDRGLTFKYGKYLKSINNTINPDFCTQLYVYGKNNISIAGANTTGMPFLQNFTYFLSPFTKSEDGNVLKHSDYMSDSLATSIIDFNALLSTKEGDFNDLITQKIALQETLDTSNTDLIDLKTEMNVILDALDIAQSNSQDTSTLVTNRNNKQIEIDNKYKEINSILIDFTVTNTCTIDGNINLTIDDKSMDIPLLATDDINGIATKINNYINSNFYNYNNKFPLSPTFKCISNEAVISVTYFTTKDEVDFNITFTDTDNTGMLLTIGIKTNNGLENQISNINNQMTELTNLLSMSENFTSDQIMELKRSFIIKKEVRNEYISDAQELLNWGKLEFAKIYQPPTVIEIDIIDLFSCIAIGTQYDRDKLQLGEIVNIFYDKFNLNVKAKINEIEYDFDGNSINVVISDVKEINKDKDKYLQLLNKTINAGIAVEVNKDNWSDIDSTNNKLAAIINTLQGNIKNQITLNVNENVEISKRGIYITSPDSPLDVLIIQNGVLAISNDGGNTWGHCVSKLGIIGEKIVGKLLCGLNLEIDASDAEGNKTFLVNQNGVEIYNMILSLLRSDNKTQILLDPTVGFKIQKNTGTIDTPVWIDVLYINNDGDLVTTGNIVIGSGTNSVFHADENGLYLGSNEFSSAPFRVDLSGNAYMSKLTAENADISGDVDITGSLEIQGTDILDTIDNVKTINGQYLSSNSIGSSKIIDLNADKITAGTITGSTIKTGADGNTRVELKSNWADIDVYHSLLKLLTIYDGGNYTNIYSPSNKPIIIGNNGYTGVISAEGNWDFTSANVTGIVAKFM